MAALYVANLLTVLVTAWAVWERRVTFGSRWDAPLTYAVALTGAGVALDSPWPEVAAASFRLSGNYYLFSTLGQICFLFGTALGIKAIYLRLMPDEAIARFMHRLIVLVSAASLVMLTCLVTSPATSAFTARHLYLLIPDSWMRVYWIAYLGTFFAMGMVAMFGTLRNRRHSRSAMLNVWIGGQFIAALSIVLIGAEIARGQTDIAAMMIWPAGYAAIIVSAVAVALSWRHRMAAMSMPPGK